MIARPDAFDTSVIVPALLAPHPNHLRCRATITDALRGQLRPVLPGPVLVESYSVLTRMPGGLSADVARQALTLAFRGRSTVCSVDEDGLWEALQHWPDLGAAGGRAYDAHVLACARAGGAGRLWTFNARHFRDLDLGDVEICVPG